MKCAIIQYNFVVFDKVRVKIMAFEESSAASLCHPLLMIQVHCVLAKFYMRQKKSDIIWKEKSHYLA